MMTSNKTGRIIRIISNLYTVSSDEKTYDCRARGKFLYSKLTPLVGDIVEFDPENLYIMDIQKRENVLNRPNVANVKKCIVVASLKHPDFSATLLDKMLTNVILSNVEPIICFSKYDLLSEEEKKKYNEIINYYNKIGIPAFLNTDTINIKKNISGDVVVLTGQTGSGKSSLINKFDASLNLKTDEISYALGRGKHTTRHVELFKIDDFYVVDTPGFSALDVIDSENIRFAFFEFDNNACKFRDCKHINEIGCAVKEQVKNNEVLESRYNSYLSMVKK